MNDLHLRFPNREHADVPIGAGVHGVDLRRDEQARIAVGADAKTPLVRFCVDRRGVWLTVAEGSRGVHVNGRPVRRMAMLRTGDSIFVDDVEMILAGPPPRQPPRNAMAGAASAGDQRIILRGVGGQHHGRSFTLARPRVVGRVPEADIRIDDPAFADRHARLELVGEDVLLRDLGSADGTAVNGEMVRDALLAPGDQIVFDAHHRFVVEAPLRTPAGEGGGGGRDAMASDGDAGVQDGDGPASRAVHRLPWLLLAALLLAAALSGLLLFGIR